MKRACVSVADQKMAVTADQKNGNTVLVGNEASNEDVPVATSDDVNETAPFHRNEAEASSDDDDRGEDPSPERSTRFLPERSVEQPVQAAPASLQTQKTSSAPTKTLPPASLLTKFSKQKQRVMEWVKTVVTGSRRLATDTFLLEIFALLFSASCLTAAAIVMWAFDGNPLPLLPSDLTLNAIIAGLAAASKSSLIFAVAATMSQYKWCWFQTRSTRRTRLEDLQTMDDASRGPLGSALLLFNHTALSLCSVGAVVVILALAYEPVIQQVVSYPIRPTNETTFAADTRQALAIYSA